MSEDLPADARTCLNCEAPLAGPYCSACGQRDEPPDLPLRRVLAGFAGDLFSFDGRVLHTIGILIRQPGALSRDWAAGRRARHVAPFRLYLLCSLVFVGCSASYELAKDVVGTAETEADESSDLRDRLRGGVPSGKVEVIASYIEGMGALGSRWMIVLMPFGGFGLFVLYGLQRRSYTAHFVLAIHVFCVVVLLFAVRRLVQLGVLLATGRILADVSGLANTLMLLALFGVSYVFAALAIRRFYGVGLGRALASAPAVTVGPIAVWAGILMTGMILLMAWPA